jgi:serine/threonine protein kinase
MGSVFSKICPDDNHDSKHQSAAGNAQQAEVTTASMRTKDGAEEPLLRQTTDDEREDYRAYSPRESGAGATAGSRGSDAVKHQPNNNNYETRGEPNRVTRTSEVLKNHKSFPSRSGGSAAKSLKDYELLAFLGQGSFAEVTLARHKSTRQLFAIKKISKRKIKEAGSVEQTFTERQILASLKHPFLVRLHQAFQSASDLYFVLQFAHGGDFRTFLQMFRANTLPRHPAYHPQSVVALLQNHNAADTEQHRAFLPQNMPSLSSQNDGCIPLDYIFFYAVEVAIALIHLHEHGFIYRDLKPENILMQRDGHIMLTDFGVAKQYITAAEGHQKQEQQQLHGGCGKRSDEHERRENFVGTREYMSPEILQGAPHDKQTDWWSYGCWLHEMAIGKGPFDGARSEYELYQSVVESPNLEDRVRNGMMSCCVLPDRYQKVTCATPPSLAPSAASVDGFPSADHIIQNHRDPEVGGQPQDHLPQDPSAAAAESVVNDSLAIEMARKDRNAEVCEHLMSLIVQLLCRDPARRLGGPIVLEHPFFRLPCWQSRFDCFIPTTSVPIAAGGEARILTEKFTTKAVEPPYIPRLRGNEDLHCFPCAVACSESCFATKAKRVSAASNQNDHQGPKPSDELFEFMLSIDGGPSNDSLRFHQEQQPQLPAASSSKQHYYDADAATTIESNIVNQSIVRAPDDDAPLSSESAGADGGETDRDYIVKPADSLVGIAYVVEAPDDDDDGVNRWNASQSIQAFNRSPAAFDGFSVAFFGSSRPGSMRYLNSHRSMGSSESSMRSPRGDGDHLYDAGGGGGHHAHRFPFVLPRQRSTSNGTTGGGGSSGGAGGGAFANFTYQEASALSA